ncbi:MAG: glycosyltransferase [Pseudonocardiaceae bacterium]|nr:glycosyltransferase [Pseudonocardiaceae bacterium]
MVAYQPAILYIDSFRYLSNVDDLWPGGVNPIGYEAFVLRPLLWFGNLELVTLVQHLVGIGMGVAIYSLARRHGARRWLAAVASAPILLDGYQLQIEQNIMTDVWMQALVVLSMWLLIGRGVPNTRRIVFAGAILGLASIFRVISVAMIVPLLGYLVIVGGAWRSRAGWTGIWKRCAAGLAGFAVVLAAYLGYFWVSIGYPGFTGHVTNTLYGRAAVEANCDKLNVSPEVRAMCPAEPQGQRLSIDHYSHTGANEQWRSQFPADWDVPELQRQFGLAVYRAQPLDMIGGILTDFMKGFAPTRTSSPHDVPLDRWQFQTDYPIFGKPGEAEEHALEFSGEKPHANTLAAVLLRGYQLNMGYTPGTLLAVFGALGAIGGLGIGRARHSGIRAAALLPTGLAFTVLFASAVYEFSWRYQLPALALLPLAGVLGITALVGPARRPQPLKAKRAKLNPFPDPVDMAALREFSARYGNVRFSPVVIVIAAYNEEDGLGPVLDGLPSSSCGMSVDVLVVADGCKDQTARVAREHGAYTCVAPTNRGQGAALRLGYQLAGQNGARYVVTTDADGQYDINELPMLLEPLAHDEADFVSGSRRLGEEHAADRVRWLGTRVFAILASVLARRRITDTSFGFRGIRAELACEVRLQQPQYQSSELMLGLLALGARYREQPMTMNVRSAGTTKKGNNLVYGYNYAKAMTGTWSRDYLLRRGRRTRGQVVRT